MRVTSLLLRRHAPHDRAGAAGERTCCLQVAAGTAAAAGAAAAAAGAAGQHPAPQQTGSAHPGAAPAADRPWNAADAMVFADCMHLMDTRRALQAAHRHLRHRGLLLVQWTNLDLSSELVQQLEEVLEEAVPGYIRYDCQHDPSVWAPRLQMGGLFRLIDFMSAPHSLSLPPAALMDALDQRGPLRSRHGSSSRRSFHHRLQHLIDTHCTEMAAVAPASASSQACQRRRILLPLHTKAYLLARSPGPPGGAAAVVSPSGQRARGALEPEKACLFCGAPVTVD
ncbi:methyltransferase isoform B [Micractinium conductrix]|uniref:Methyltransferase isoform B n=1 Tax=Micractinium conductrix TaxID=554055 RepID=A0A2P6VLT2_9CHLO|nr:methyltransferase isoform B [Micractinium conductrix]|eukprot:PSC75066.1 methyltransferase isoform B [Micractinium conductrix]